MINIHGQTHVLDKLGVIESLINLRTIVAQTNFALGAIFFI
jgi:YbbR domain-containing protein